MAYSKTAANQNSAIRARAFEIMAAEDPPDPWHYWRYTMIDQLQAEYPDIPRGRIATASAHAYRARLAEDAGGASAEETAAITNRTVYPAVDLPPNYRPAIETAETITADLADDIDGWRQWAADQIEAAIRHTHAAGGAVVNVQLDIVIQSKPDGTRL